MNIDFDLPANGSVVSQPVGVFKYLIVRTAANPFQISFDGSYFEDAKQNDKWDKSSRIPAYEKIYLRAKDGVGETVSLVFDTKPFSNQDTVITGTITANIASVTADLANDIANCVAGTPGQFFVASVVGAPSQFVGATLYCRWAMIMGCKDVAGTPNTGNVKVGVSGVVGGQPLVITPGASVVIPQPAGAKMDLKLWYLSIANAGDGIAVIYF